MADVLLPQTARELLAALLDAQVTRAQTYAALDAAFRRYLDAFDDAAFEAHVRDCTAAFGRCSLRVRAIQAALRDLLPADAGAAAAFQRAHGVALRFARDTAERVIDELQALEKSKLGLTTQLQQLLAARAKHERLSHAHEHTATPQLWFAVRPESELDERVGDALLDVRRELGDTTRAIVELLDDMRCELRDA